jgi:hypothetical protein
MKVWPEFAKSPLRRGAAYAVLHPVWYNICGFLGGGKPYHAIGMLQHE